MPKKLFPTEPAVTFIELYEQFLEVDRNFLVKTDDPVAPTFADALIAQHYPPQTELPLD